MRTRRLLPDDALYWRKAVQRLLLQDGDESRLIHAADAGKALADERCYLIVAGTDSTPTGLLSAYRFPDLQSGGQLVYLYDIVVAADCRRSGIGRDLVDTLIRHCRDDGVTTIWAGTDLRNDAARCFFEDTGAHLAGDAYAEYEWLLEN